MKLGNKIRYLRSVERTLRGLGRPMTQMETVRAIKKQQGRTLSQAYTLRLKEGFVRI